MTLAQLRYAITVANSNSMNEAARTLFISQPSLSSAIKELEEEIGVELFRRTNRGISVTPEGEEFLGYARQVVEQYELIESKYVSKERTKKKFSVSMQHYTFAVNAFVEMVKQFGMDEYEFAVHETRTYDIITDVKDFKTLGKIGGKTLGIFLGGTAIAVAIGLVLCNIMQIGARFVMESAQAYDAKEIPSIVDTLMDIIPTNPFNSLSTQNLLQIIFFSLLLGFALIKLGEKGEPVLNFFRAWTEAWKEITNIVLEFTPYGVFGLMANIVGKYGMDVMLPYMKTIAACYITCALFTVFVQGGLMAGLYGGISPVRFFSVMKEAMLFVFATCSSVATIPLNLKCTKELGVSDKIADFVIPFGAVMNMNGTAIYEAVAVIFASQVFGIQLTLTQQIMVMVTAVLASVGTAGIPGSGLVMLTIVLNAVHLPLETIGLLAGIDRILNMARVIPNIVGDAAAAVVVAKSEGELNTVGLKK